VYKMTAVFKQRLKMLRKVKKVKISLRGLKYNYGFLSILVIYLDWILFSVDSWSRLILAIDLLIFLVV